MLNSVNYFIFNFSSMYSSFFLEKKWEEVSAKQNLHQKRLLPSVRARRSSQKKFTKKIKPKNLNPPNCMELSLTREFPMKTSRCYFNCNSTVMSSFDAREVSSWIQQLHVCSSRLSTLFYVFFSNIFCAFLFYEEDLTSNYKIKSVW